MLNNNRSSSYVYCIEKPFFFLLYIALLSLKAESRYRCPRFSERDDLFRSGYIKESVFYFDILGSWWNLLLERHAVHIRWCSSLFIPLNAFGSVSLLKGIGDPFSSSSFLRLPLHMRRPARVNNSQSAIKLNGERHVKETRRHPSARPPSKTKRRKKGRESAGEPIGEKSISRAIVCKGYPPLALVFVVVVYGAHAYSHMQMERIFFFSFWKKGGGPSWLNVNSFSWEFCSLIAVRRVLSMCVCVCLHSGGVKPGFS